MAASGELICPTSELSRNPNSNVQFVPKWRIRQAGTWILFACQQGPSLTLRRHEASSYRLGDRVSRSKVTDDLVTAVATTVGDGRNIQRRDDMITPLDCAGCRQNDRRTALVLGAAAASVLAGAWTHPGASRLHPVTVPLLSVPIPLSKAWRPISTGRRSDLEEH